jgi:gluconolactonase
MLVNFKSLYLLVPLVLFLVNTIVPDTKRFEKMPAMLRNDTTGLIAPGATLQLVSDQFSFTEGPAVDKEGNIYFTDQPNDAIWKWETNGTLSLFLNKTGRANGLYIDAVGNIIACADADNELWKISPEGNVTVLYKSPEGRKLNGPNDLWIDKSGGIYITDPYYQRPYWERKAPDIKGQHVYYLPPGKKKLVAVAEDLNQPNGIVGTPDGRHLFVADIGAGKTYKYEIGTDGELKKKLLFVEQGSDGMTLDEQGNLYITGNGVTVYNREGVKIEHIPVPEKWTGNVCFGGAQRDQLFITASKGVYLLRMNVKGVE